MSWLTNLGEAALYAQTVNTLGPAYYITGEVKKDLREQGKEEEAKQIEKAEAIGTAGGAIAGLTLGKGVPLITRGISAFRTAFPKVATGIDLVLTADGIRNLATKNGILKTVNYAKDGKWGRAALSGLGDALDLSGGISLIGRTVKGVKNTINYGRQWKSTFKDLNKIREKIRSYVHTLAKKHPTGVNGGANFNLSLEPKLVGLYPVGDIQGGNYTWLSTYDADRIGTALSLAKFARPPRNFIDGLYDYAPFLKSVMTPEKPLSIFPALRRSLSLQAANSGAQITFNPANYVTSFFDGFLGKNWAPRHVSGGFAHELQHSVQNLHLTPLAVTSRGTYFMAPKDSPFAEFFGKPTKLGVSLWTLSPKEFDAELLNWRLQNNNWKPVDEMDYNSYSQLRDFLQDRFWKNGQVRHGSEAVNENIQSLFDWARYGIPIRWNNVKELYSVPDNAADKVLQIGSKLGYWKQGGSIKIKKKNLGSFTRYCNGKVTEECIRKGKNSSNPTTRKRANFAANARKWKHEEGGTINYLNYFK